MTKEKREILEKLEVGTTYSGVDVICRQYKEIERLNKEIETLKQPQVFIDTQDMEERYAQGLYEDFIEEEYEKLIFDYLSNNCKEFDDEHIKKLVDLKVKQHLSSQKEIERLNIIINELEKILDENVELTYVHNGKRQYNKTLTEGGLLFRDYIKSKLQELKGSDK